MLLFHKDPPNAVLTWESDNDSMAFAEVILTNAMWNNATGFIEYSYTFETGYTLPSNFSDVSLFIDGWFGSCGGHWQDTCFLVGVFGGGEYTCEDGYRSHQRQGGQIPNTQCITDKEWECWLGPPVLETWTYCEGVLNHYGDVPGTMKWTDEGGIVPA